MDKLYFNSDITLLKECLNTFRGAVDYPLAKKEAEQALLEEIAASDAPINATLYEQYSRNLRKAVDGVFAEDNSGGLSDRLRANVSRFAAYKAMYVETAVKNCLNDPAIPEKERPEMAKRILRVFDRYQDAEYNTAVARSRTAKQFEEYMQPDNVRLFPCLRWLPSRSAVPRSTHQQFYWGVWKKTDKFWEKFSPGTEWGCKCDVEECDDEPDPKYPDNYNPQTGEVTEDSEQAKKNRGIKHDNPYHSGKIFTDDASYIRSTSNSKRKKVIKMMNEVEWLRTKNDKEKRERFNKTSCFCNIDGQTKDVKIISETYGELVHAMQYSENRVLKNEGIEHISKWLKNAVCIGRKESDTSHNTGKTKKLKERTDYFYYFKAKMYGIYDCYIHIGRYKADKKLYLYTISEGEPKDLENPIW